MENVNNVEVMNLRGELIRLEQVRFCFFLHSSVQYVDLSQELTVRPNDAALLQQEQEILVRQIRFVSRDL